MSNPPRGDAVGFRRVRLLLTTLQDLERARAERFERLRLWPAEDDPSVLNQADARDRNLGVPGI